MPFRFLKIALICAIGGSAFNFAAPAASEETSDGQTTVVKPGKVGSDEALELSLDQAMWTALAFEDAAKLADLLKRGADPNKPEKLSEMTPLMAAESAKLVRLLLAANADPNQRDRIGRTAMHHAVKAREAASIIRLLGKAGADVNARANDSAECTPLLSALEYYLESKERQETMTAMRILVHLGAKVDMPDANGRTPLAIAAALNQPELVRLLIELGANPDLRLANGRTPVDYAREADAKAALEAFKSASSGAPGRTRSN